MRRRRWLWPARLVLGGVVLGAVGLVGWIAFASWNDSRTETFEGLPLGIVHRADLDEVLLVDGDIEGVRRTLIECELEMIVTEGSGIHGARILEIVPDGSRVKKDEVMVRFDSSGYEEMARLQKITVERSQSELDQAQFDLDAAQVAHRGYVEGESIQTLQQLRGQIALQESDLQQAREHLKFVEEMRGLTYISAAELSTARTTVLKLEQSFDQARLALKNQVRFKTPKTTQELKTKVENAESRVRFGKEQLETATKRLENLQKMIEKCTLKAPHDGMVVYFDQFYGGDYKFVEPGAEIFQGQPLIYLPDMSEVAVELMLHESIASGVKVGMPAEIQIPALDGMVVSGKVTWINLLPTEDWMAGMDIKAFEARVKLDKTPEGILPSMSAEVRIKTHHRDDLLVIPSEALAMREGRGVCFVAGRKGIERREVKVHRGNRDLLEVVDGLVEGERVVLRPAEVLGLPPDQGGNPFSDMPSPGAIASHEKVEAPAADVLEAASEMTRGNAPVPSGADSSG